jgi:aerobic carbon-monoxide dehydrogenase small subunit|uniref:(2Fe-2S)-binding protein n=1 Tax=Orrella sp. TaxID=1921583 RepID=UPI004048A10F
MKYEQITFTVNGQKFDIGVEPRKTLADALRDDCGLTGTHVGCEHGVCGTCTVIVDGKAVRACLMFAFQAQDSTITTVEGLSNPDGTLCDLQQSFIDNHSLQCGFCTPGYLTLITAALEENPRLTDEEIIGVVSSNLCRCTGYVNIIKAVQQVRDQRSANGHAN